MSTINTYTKSGNPVAYGNKVPPASLGREIDGKIYQHPRLRQDEGIGAGGSVTVTNRTASPRSTQRRTASLGMGATNTQERRY